MNPLDTVTLEEIIDELKRRFHTGALLLNGVPDHDGGSQMSWWGNTNWRIGACEQMAFCWKMGEFHDAKDRFCGDES